MVCDQCGASRPRAGACPRCGAPAPGTYSSMRQWRAPGAGRARHGSGAEWGDDDAAMDTPGGSGRRRRRGGREDYDDEMDLERALVPSPPSMGLSELPGAGSPALPGLPAIEEQEYAMGIRRPAFIPATGEHRGTKPGTWRVVSGLLSVLLICVASCGLVGLLGRGTVARLLAGPIKTSLTPEAINYSMVPATPVGTPGPAANYVTSVVTAKAIDANYNAVGVTSRFLINSMVYVVVTVRGVPKGQQHTVSVHWYLQGVDIGLEQERSEQTSKVVTENSNVSFGVVYPVAGVGMAKIYWDLPANDPGTATNDPHLAQTIVFGVIQPTPTPTASKAPTTATATSTKGK